MNTYLFNDLGFDGEDQFFMRPRLPGESCRECALSVADRCLNCMDEPRKTARAVEQWEALAQKRRVEDALKNRRRQLLEITERLRSVQIELAGLVDDEPSAGLEHTHYLVVRAVRAAAAAARRQTENS